MTAAKRQSRVRLPLTFTSGEVEKEGNPE